MAKKKNGVSAPEGFSEISSTLDGFMVFEPGNTIQGLYRGVYVSKNSKFNSRAHLIELTEAGTNASNKDGDFSADVGDTIGVNEKGYTKPMNKLGQGQEVWMCIEGKDPGEKGAWICKIAVRD